MSKPEIVLHHLNASRSERLFWLLEELEVPYTVKVYFRLPTRTAPPELKKVSPYGKVRLASASTSLALLLASPNDPRLRFVFQIVRTDHAKLPQAPIVELDGEVLTESGYIIHRLITGFPNSNVEHAASNNSTFWSHFAEGSMMNLFQAGAVVGSTAAGFCRGMMGQLGEEEKNGVGRYSKWVLDEYLKPQNQTNLDEIEAFLGARPGKYFTGTEVPGEGDFMLFFGINSIMAGVRKDAGYKIGPATRGWWDMVNARPACRRAMERLKEEEETQKSKM